ncbi:plasmid maintenance protein CcdB [Aliihoeflea aestuarii]|jgi:toxin CcdB|uniref:CcdB family protein n=1 Tax=Aliihoeflea aestuarii TaxID=453840 RepID=UPI0020929CDD|nr:CcdB family protein [Aliihoeflea aestuarii]MCO6391202.1 plasmid maintenance protein CcdB [Aliihoeflea aestuarii]
MGRHDIYRLADGSFVLDVQSSLLDIIGSRVVIPLLPANSTPRKLPRLHPVFDVEGTSYLCATHLISAMPEAELTVRVATLSANADEITAALDMLFQGF